MEIQDQKSNSLDPRGLTKEHYFTQRNDMDVMDIFTSDGDGAEDDGTLYSLSSEFLEAAIVLSQTPPIIINFSIAIYYLLSHSTELMLKAFLHKKGRTIRELRTIGHNLECWLTTNLTSRCYGKFVCCRSQISAERGVMFWKKPSVALDGLKKG